jgi:uncharacterized membrane protein
MGIKLKVPPTGGFFSGVNSSHNCRHYVTDEAWRSSYPVIKHKATGRGNDMRSLAELQRRRARRNQLARVKDTLILCLFSSYCSVSAAGEVLDLSVTADDGEYEVKIVAVVDAPEDYVYRVVTDYRHINRINPAVVSVDVHEGDGVVRVQHHSKHLMGPFCFSFDWTGDIVETQPGRLEITTIPEMSSFSSGSAVWVIKSQGDRTWVLHESKLEPKFFIPPLVGEYFVKGHMRDSILTTFNRIECHAQSLLAQNTPQAAQHADDLMADSAECKEPPGNDVGLMARNR